MENDVNEKSRAPSWTRREAFCSLCLGAAAAVLSTSGGSAAPAVPNGAIIRTVLRDYRPEELAGRATLFHEHVSLAPDFLARFERYSAETRTLNGPSAPALPAAPTEAFMQDMELMTNELAIAKREGISCIVDGGHPDMGRDINALKQLSMRSGMPIVAGAGFYTQPFYPTTLSAMSEDQIAQHLIEQVSADRAGVFGEIGSWDDMTAMERKVFRAIGKAHTATNLSIFTHTGIPGKAALEQLDILEDAGVAPNRIAIGHLGNLVDPNVQVHKAICRRGAFVGFDRQGRPEDVQQVPLVMGLLDAGFANNLLFSSDLARANALKRFDSTLGYAKTLTVFVPKLRAAGASEEVLRQIMVDNSRRFLAFVPK
jgi:phosphotriesterase-related protein